MRLVPGLIFFLFKNFNLAISSNEVQKLISARSSCNKNFTNILVYKEPILPHGGQAVLVGKLLDRFIQSLKMFIHGRDFDNDCFEVWAPLLAESFLLISRWLGKLDKSNEPLFDQLIYARSMFLGMSEAAESVKEFNQYNTEQHLVRLILQLNIGIYALLYSHGIPDPKIKGYQHTVYRFTSNVLYWRDDFMGLEKVSPHIASLLERQFEKAEKTLEHLSLYRSQKK